LICFSDSSAAPIARIGAAVVLAACSASQAFSSPDGAEWDSIDQAPGCLSCHLDSPELRDSQALSIEGLPKRPEAGQSYPLTIVLNDPALRNAGFLLSVLADNADAGEFTAIEGEIETNGAQARSTYDSSTPSSPGEARWQLTWTAPTALGEPLHFDLWGNAGNRDLSPLGDRLHHRIWQLPAAP